MTENYPPAPPQWTEPPPAPPGEPRGTRDVVKEQTADLGSATVQAGQHTADVARQQTSQVVAEATQQGRDLLAQAEERMGEQVAQGQQRLAEELLSLGDELHSMAESSEQQGTASELARQVAGRARDAGRWLDARGPAEVVDEVQSFARRRPGMFLALALGAGLVAGRLTRGIKAASSAGEPSASPAGQGAAAYADTGQAGFPGDGGYPTGTAGGVTPGLSVPAGSGEPPTSVPPVGNPPWGTEETFIEETYVEERPVRGGHLARHHGHPRPGRAAGGHRGARRPADHADRA